MIVCHLLQQPSGPEISVITVRYVFGVVWKEELWVRGSSERIFAVIRRITFMQSTRGRYCFRALCVS